mmetsp:Transcript_84200/g.234845  ORF Transcript_84200/g.234845 Transcript_84200/m.234845 type:complete len:344 (-) Transcript_84200:1815-2846(-)
MLHGRLRVDYDVAGHAERAVRLGLRQHLVAFPRRFRLGHLLEKFLYSAGLPARVADQHPSRQSFALLAGFLPKFFEAMPCGLASLLKARDGVLERPSRCGGLLSLRLDKLQHVGESGLRGFQGRLGGRHLLFSLHWLSERPREVRDVSLQGDEFAFEGRESLLRLKMFVEVLADVPVRVEALLCVHEAVPQRRDLGQTLPLDFALGRRPRPSNANVDLGTGRRDCILRTVDQGLRVVDRVPELTALLISHDDLGAAPSEVCSRNCCHLNSFLGAADVLLNVALECEHSVRALLGKPLRDLGLGEFVRKLLAHCLEARNELFQPRGDLGILFQASGCGVDFLGQ